MTDKDPPEKGGINEKNINISDRDCDGDNGTPMDHNLYEAVQLDGSNEVTAVEISTSKRQESSRSLQTASGDISLIKKQFNLQKPHIYNNKIYVFLEKINNENIGKLHPMVVGHILHKKLGVSNINKIEKVGRNRVKVELKSIRDANKLINNDKLNDEHIRAFIPNNLLERKGIIKFVDTSFDDKYLFENIISPYRITEVKRLQRKIVKEDGHIFVPKQTVLLTFEGNVLPSTVFINYVACTVEPYVQKVIQCYKCLRYGHVAKQCNSSNSLCVNCSKELDSGHKCRDPQDRFCLFCKNNTHKTISKDCPKYVEQTNIKKHMANNNLTFLESKNNIRNTFSNVVRNGMKPSVSNIESQNTFSVLDTLNYDHFPPLGTSSSNHTKNIQKQIPTQTINHPSNSRSSLSIVGTNIQNQNPNKKRKAQSPADISQQPQMFPFSFGPSQSILGQNSYITNDSLGETEEFISNFFKFFQSVLNDVNSFDDLKNINTDYVKNKLSIFYSNFSNNEQREED